MISAKTQKKKSHWRLPNEVQHFFDISAWSLLYTGVYFYSFQWIGIRHICCITMVFTYEFDCFFSCWAHVNLTITIQISNYLDLADAWYIYCFSSFINTQNTVWKTFGLCICSFESLFPESNSNFICFCIRRFGLVHLSGGKQL